jgi:3D-(3,5/4)-trihydroxycyclohexane-1,2-dione acylhydrolase (decyclizing)
MSSQRIREGAPLIAGASAIFGHGNVSGPGEALHGARDVLPTLRGQNEQTVAHAAIACAKQMRRRGAMMVTSSIGPGATNRVTAAASAHVNRLPVSLVPGDVFVGRGPDPVLQQIEISATPLSAPTTASALSADISTALPGPSSCLPRCPARWR